MPHTHIIHVCTYACTHTTHTQTQTLQAELTKQQNDFKIKLKELEDSLLSRLSSAGGNFLGDTALVENLETTKRTAHEIEKKVEEALATEKRINEAREHYRPAASQASLLYFILNDLEKINPLYQFSLKICWLKLFVFNANGDTHRLMVIVSLYCRPSVWYSTMQ